MSTREIEQDDIYELEGKQFVAVRFPAPNTAPCKHCGLSWSVHWAPSAFCSLDDESLQQYEPRPTRPQG